MSGYFSVLNFFPTSQELLNKVCNSACVLVQAELLQILFKSDDGG